jgi:hypothetical protein
MANSNSTLKKRPKSAALPSVAPLVITPDDGLVPYNIESLEGDPPISAYADAAAHWGLPVWAMMIPGATRDMFEDNCTKMLRLIRLMGDYLDSSDSQRSSIETVAAGLAELHRSKGAAELAHV